MNIPLKRYDDYYGAAAFALCKATETYDNAKSSFSTYAFKCIQNEIRRELIYQNQYNFKNISIVYYNNKASGRNSEIKYLDMLSEYNDIESEVIANECFKDILSALSHREKKLLYLLEKGLTQSQAGNVLGLSQSQISRMKSKIIRLLKK